MKSPPALLPSGVLSDFIRNASPEEKRRVYGVVMDKVFEQQAAVVMAAEKIGTSQVKEPAPT